MRHWPIFLTLLLLAGGGIGISLTLMTLETCRVAKILSLEARDLVEIHSELGLDPFLNTQDLQKNYIQPRLETVRLVAQAILSSRTHFLLGSQVQMALTEIANATDLIPAIENYSTVAPVLLQCEVASPAKSPQNDSKDGHDWDNSERFSKYLQTQITATRLAFEQAKTMAAQRQKEWAADAVLFCNSNSAIQSMRAVQNEHATRCRQQPRRFEKGCAKEIRARLSAEIEQLDGIRLINEHKFVTKWGESLYEKVHCD